MMPIRPNDFWWHMAVGREILSTGAIPVVDNYSFTMLGTPYPSYQMFWLADIGLFTIYELGGAALVVFIQSFAITLTYALLLLTCRKVSNSWRVAVAATLFAIVLGFHNWSVRPQTISYLVGVSFLLAIYSFRQRYNLKWLLVFPLGMLLWVNSHGSFVIGFVLIGIWIGDEVWQLLVAWYKKERDLEWTVLAAPSIALATTLIVSLINPRGFGIVNYVSTLTSNPVVQNIVPEWSPPTFDTLYGAIYLIALLFSASLLALSPKRPNFTQLITFLIFGALGLKTTRGIIWFGLVMAPVVANHVQAIVDKRNEGKLSKPPRKGSVVVNLLILIILFVTAVISLPWLKGYLPLPSQKVGLISADTPINATQFLIEQNPPGELFHDMGHGSYLIWAAQPGYKVFADPRIELFPRDIWWDYVSVINVIPGWEALLEKYEVNTILLNPAAQKSLVSALNDSNNWRKTFEDQSGIIFIRNDVDIIN